MLSITKRQKTVYDIISENPGISYIEIASQLRVSRGNIYNCCLVMLNKNILTSDKSIYVPGGRNFWIIPETKFITLDRLTKRIAMEMEEAEKNVEISCLHRQTIFCNGASPNTEIDYGCDEGMIL